MQVNLAIALYAHI